MRAQRWLQSAGLALAMSGVATCSSAPRSPFFGDEKYLVLGVSPEEEANAVSKELATNGRREHLRLRGSTFTALGFTEPDGRPAWVRAVTQRGIELALDPTPSHPLERGVRYELIAPETPGLFDADGDGFDELIILQRSYEHDDPCLLAYRIQNTGEVDLITDEHHAADVAKDAISGVLPCGVSAEADGGVLSDPGATEPKPPE